MNVKCALAWFDLKRSLPRNTWDQYLRYQRRVQTAGVYWNKKSFVPFDVHSYCMSSVTVPAEGQEEDTTEQKQRSERFSLTKAEEEGLAATCSIFSNCCYDHFWSAESSLSLPMTSCLGINMHVYNQTHTLFFLCLELHSTFQPPWRLELMRCEQK